MIAKMQVSSELLVQLLNLPDNTSFVGARCEYPFREVEFYVSNPDIPEGTTTIRPEFVSYRDADCGHVFKVEMTDWGAEA